jgi:uncharacterized membrane protein YbhN (UPF0104 family)
MTIVRCRCYIAVTNKWNVAAANRLLDLLVEPQLLTAGRISKVSSITARTIIRRFGLKGASVAISALIITVALITLYRLLSDIDLGRVAAALRAQSVPDMLIAGIFVVAGYVTLTFYDLFALRVIGHRKVPFAVAAMASFTSYTIGHTVGAAVLTGGLIRLRVYSPWGLNVVDIAKIAFLTGMTFWLGNALVLGAAVLIAPQAASAVDHLSLWANRLIGLTGLIVLAGYVIWLAPRPRAVGRSDWRITLPSWQFTLLQTAIGATDLSLVTLAMYTVLPASPSVDFPTVLVIFIASTLLGAVSHAPGSLGIIEAGMLTGLPGFQKEDLLASLLVFRVLYFLIPLLLATCILGIRELRIAIQRARRRHLRQGRNLVRRPGAR